MRTSLLVCVALSLVACKPKLAEPVAPAAQTPLDPRIDAALQLRASDQREQALLLLEKVRADALGRGDLRSAAVAWHRSADVLNDLDREPEARARYETALEEHLRNGDVGLAGTAANDRGLAGENMEDEALWFGKALGYRRAISDLKGIRVSGNNLGVRLFYMERWDESARAYDEALDAAKRTGDASGEAKVHANLALLYALRAEGGFPEVVENTPPPVKADDPFEVQARAHFTAGMDAAKRAGEPPDTVCGYFGRYENRCPRYGWTPPPEPDDAADEPDDSEAPSTAP